MFLKRPDPHEEALMILKEQINHLVATPGSQVRGRGGLGPGRTEDSGASREPETSRPISHDPALAWPGPSVGPTCCPLSTLFVVGAAAQRGCGPHEASDQCTKAIHGVHSR